MLQVNETNIFINYDKDDDKDGYGDKHGDTMMIDGNNGDNNHNN